MSVYTTLTISRSAAIAKLAELRNERQPTNEELGNELDMLLEHTLYNFTVADDVYIDDSINGSNDDASLRWLKLKDD